MSDVEAKAPSVRPSLVAEVTATADDGRVEVVLTGDRNDKKRVLARDPALHRDPVSTALTPRIGKGGESEVYELYGWRLSRMNEPGDVLVTYALLVEVPPAGGPVWALWYEDHQEVPTRLWTGEGTLTTSPRGASQLVLDLTDADGGEKLHVEGLLRVR